MIIGYEKYKMNTYNRKVYDSTSIKVKNVINHRTER